MFVVENSNTNTRLVPRLVRGILLPEFIRINGTSIILTARDFDRLRDEDGIITIDREQKPELV